MHEVNAVGVLCDFMTGPNEPARFDLVEAGKTQANDEAEDICPTPTGVEHEEDPYGSQGERKNPCGNPGPIAAECNIGHDPREKVGDAKEKVVRDAIEERTAFQDD